MHRIILVDARGAMREAYRALIEREPDMSVVAECTSPLELDVAVDALRPDVVVLGLSSTGIAVPDFLPLRTRHPQLRVVLLDANGVQPRFAIALARGADACMDCSAASAGELVPALRAVMIGKVYLGPTPG